MEGYGYISDDSDFYGDEKAQRRLKRRCAETDVHGYWASHSQLINVIAFEGRAQEEALKETSPSVASIAPNIKSTVAREPYNPYRHLENAKKLDETPSEFLQRFPPLTSYSNDGWLWVANPYAPRDKEPEGRNVEFIKQMRQLLDEYLEKKRKLTEANPNKPAATITKTLSADRDRLKEEITEGAKKANMTCGKWMLFPAEEDTPRVWLKVVEAVSAGKLGIAAKVATDSKPGSKERLICIYTKDFTDVVDVSRELEIMTDLQLVDRDASRSIYYKCDAYTYLDIYSDNPYGLKASQYASRDIFAKPKTTPSKPQKKLTDGFFKTRESPFKKR